MPKKILFVMFLCSVFLYPQDTLLFNASCIPYTDSTIVFKPANYDSSISYPLLFMLHGWAGSYSQWSKDADLQGYADKDSLIIVCPDGFYDSWYINSPVEKNSQYVKFFFKELVPAVFNKYNIDKKNIFITGLSMGGHGAIYLYLTHRKFFKSAGSTSGILDITAFPNNWGLPKVLGPYTSSPNRWKKYSDINLLNKIKGNKIPIIVDCGTEDFSFDVNKRFDEKCKELGIPIDFITGPGKHSHEYWKQSIVKHFQFFKSLIDKH